MAAFLGAGVFGTRILLNSDEGGGAAEGQQRQAVRVGVTKPQVRSIDETVSAVGTLRPVRTVDIAPNVAGRVTEVLVESGEQVSQGDLLVQLDDRAARAALEEAEATLRETKKEYERYQQLEDSNAAAESRLEQARGAFRRAEAAVMMARATLEDREIIAPFDGKLDVVDIEPGSFLTGSETVTRLSDLSSMEVTVTLPERYFERVTPGLTVAVATPAYPNATFEGPVFLRATQIDIRTRSFEVRARIDNKDGRLVGGMFANSSIVLGSYDGMAVPDDAIISEGLTTYVYTVSENTATRTDVDVGASIGQLIEVREGLDAQDSVVVAGWDRLSDGAPVEIDEDFNEEGLN